MGTSEPEEAPARAGVKWRPLPVSIWSTPPGMAVRSQQRRRGGSTRGERAAADQDGRAPSIPG